MSAPAPTIAERVRRAIAWQSGLDLADILDDSRFDEDLGFDSFDAIELTMAVEDDLDIPLDEDAVAAARTVAELIALVERTLQAHSAPAATVAGSAP